MSACLALAPSRAASPSWPAEAWIAREPRTRRWPAPAPGEHVALDRVVAAVVRRRAAALAGAEIVVDVDPPGLAVRTPFADELRRCISLVLSAAAARPAVARLEIAIRAIATAERTTALQFAVRIATSETGERRSSFAAIERLLLERAAAIVRRLGGLLVVDRRSPSETRTALELDVAEIVLAPLPVWAAEAAPALIVTPRAVAARSWSRALRCAGLRVEELRSLSALLARCEPVAGGRPAPTLVLVDEILVRHASESLVALGGALAASGVEPRRVVVAAAGFAHAEDTVASVRLGVRRQPAPLLAVELLRDLARGSMAPSVAEEY